MRRLRITYETELGEREGSKMRDQYGLDPTGARLIALAESHTWNTGDYVLVELADGSVLSWLVVAWPFVVTHPCPVERAA